MNEMKYSFKYSNWDLPRYLEIRKEVANMKRQGAMLLVKEAETIEAEMRELEQSLKETTEQGDQQP